MDRRSEEELLRRVADAIERDEKARGAFDAARIEANDAGQALREAWGDLRTYQDEQVKKVLEARCAA